MSIRPMLAVDLVAVERLEQQLFHSPWSLAQLQKSLSGNFLMSVAEQQDEVVGYLIASQGGGVSDLLTIGVDPRQRRGGIGRQLLLALYEQLRLAGIDELFLEVRRSNVGAIELYQHSGMEQVGVRKGYYPSDNCPELGDNRSTPDGNSREDAIVMRYQLTAIS